MVFTWGAQPGVANLVLTGAILAIGAIAGIGFSVAQGAEPLRPQDHG